MAHATLHTSGAFAVALWLSLAASCSDDAPASSTANATGTQGSTTQPAATTVGATTTTTTTTSADGSSEGPATTDASESDDDSNEGAECSVYDQDCAEGEKCVPWSDQPDLVPDDIRCCPVVGGAPGLQTGDTCTVEGYFGSCLDDCAVGNFCMDIDGDGEGVCQPMCSGSANNPTCQADEACLIYFAGVPLCFPKCDPLAQNCGEGQGCYPDAQAAGGTGFICLPTIGTTGDYNEYCWLLSNCLPGFVCISPDFMPECAAPVGCCTPLCDTSEPDACSEFHPDMQCVSWYFGGQTPPSVTLEDVGACTIPQ